jgi:hypothetical protein
MQHSGCTLALFVSVASFGSCSHGHDPRPTQTDVLLRVCQLASLDYYQEHGKTPENVRDLQDFVFDENWSRPEYLTPHSYEFGTRMLRSGIDAWQRPIDVRRLDSPGTPMAWVSAGEDGTFGTDDDRESEMMWTHVTDSDNSL